MEAFGAQHGKAESQGFILSMVNNELWPDEAELDDDKVELDHQHAIDLNRYVFEKMPMPADWAALTDGDKIRVTVMDHYLAMSAAGPGACIHRDRAQRDLLDVADRIDMWATLNDLELGAEPEVPGTRVPTGTCSLYWVGAAETNKRHPTGAHACVVRFDHVGRHRCSCGATKRKGADE